MDITRRDLLKMAGVAAVGAAVGQFNAQPVEAAKKTLKLKAAPVVGSKNVTGTKSRARRRKSTSRTKSTPRTLSSSTT